MKIKAIVPGQRYAVRISQAVYQCVALQAPAEITLVPLTGRPPFRRLDAGEFERVRPKVLILRAINEDFDLTSVTIEDVLARRAGQSHPYSAHLVRPATVLRTWDEHEAKIAKEREEFNAWSVRRAERIEQAHARADAVAARLAALGVDARPQTFHTLPEVRLTLSQIETLLEQVESSREREAGTGTVTFSPVPHM